MEEVDRERPVLRESSSSSVLQQSSYIDKENVFDEPPQKKTKIEKEPEQKSKLEDRLSGILCCAVCLDLPTTCFQCVNGHLMCAGCFNHLLADARIKDEVATCPNCRCEINKSCIRNLAVEKTVRELPSECNYCGRMLPRYQLDHHQRELCEERPTTCRYRVLGCMWEGPFHESAHHEEICSFPKKTGAEILAAVEAASRQAAEEQKHYGEIFSLLSYEKITFNDLQLKPFRTDDFVTRLFYETSRFTAFNAQWVIRAKINSDTKNPALTANRSLAYQLVSKTKLQNPISLRFVAIKGPFGFINMKSKISSFEFSETESESAHFELPITSLECNELLASRNINFRLVMFQVTK